MRCAQFLGLQLVAGAIAFSPATPALSSHIRGRGTVITLQAAKEVDTDAVVKYGSAVAAQMAAIAATFGAVDVATDAILGGPLPWQAVTALFWGLSLKSRVFSPLDNSRPDLNKAVEGEKTRGFNDRTMPSWVRHAPASISIRTAPPA